ncbi:MAG: VWA domain-containing protein [Gammaproteobacteria bacterium]|nr:VWA domain-containing protein [Gammaproteobacteria bacterium]
MQHSPRRILTAAEQRLLSHHPGTAAEHRHNLNAPLDRKTDRLLREGGLEDVIALAEIAPGRVAEAMARNRLVLDHFHDHDAHARLLALTWDALDPEMRARNLRRMLMMIQKMARKVSPAARRYDGAEESVPYRFVGEELDVDASIDRLVANARIQHGKFAATRHSDFYVMERSRRPRAFAVMLDESRSMRGSKSVAAALVAAVLLLNLRPEDAYAVIGFAEHARVIRSMGQRRDRDRTLHDILEMRPSGCTDVAAGLESGLIELHKVGTSQRIGILVSDGWLNTGHDPMPLVRRFKRLHVIELPGGDHKVCADIAAAGRGVMTAVRDVSQVPAAVHQCLAA